VLTVQGFERAWKKQSTREVIFSRLLKIPLLGKILLAGALSRYCWVLESTLSTGLDLVSSLRLAANASGSPVLKGDGERMIASVKAGGTLPVAMKVRPDLYPTMLVQLVRAGEEVGSVASSFREVATWYDQDLDYKLDVLAAAIEPIMMAGLALVVGGVVLSIFLPLYGFIATIGS
jgi:type IV pilus assembly protein PilC